MTYTTKQIKEAARLCLDKKEKRPCGKCPLEREALCHLVIIRRLLWIADRKEEEI